MFSIIAFSTLYRVDDDDRKNSIRALRVEHHLLKQAYEKRIADLESQCENLSKMDAVKSSTSVGTVIDIGDVPQQQRTLIERKELEAAQEQIAQLTAEIMRVRELYQKLLDEKTKAQTCGIPLRSNVEVDFPVYQDKGDGATWLSKVPSHQSIDVYNVSQQKEDVDTLSSRGVLKLDQQHLQMHHLEDVIYGSYQSHKELGGKASKGHEAEESLDQYRQVKEEKVGPDSVIISKVMCVVCVTARCVIGGMSPQNPSKLNTRLTC